MYVYLLPSHSRQSALNWFGKIAINSPINIVFFPLGLAHKTNCLDCWFRVGACIAAGIMFSFSVLLLHYCCYDSWSFGGRGCYLFFRIFVCQFYFLPVISFCLRATVLSFVSSTYHCRVFVLIMTIVLYNKLLFNVFSHEVILDRL